MYCTKFKNVISVETSQEANYHDKEDLIPAQTYEHSEIYVMMNL